MFLIFDIGGTKIRMASVDDGKTFSQPVVFTNPKNFERAMEMIGEKSKELIGKIKVEKVAGGAPGTFNKEKSALLRSPNLPDWIDRPLKKTLEEILEAPVLLENDTALVGLGEARAGAGQGSKIVVYVTVSTGVNGVRIVDGRIDENVYGFEMGHQIIDADGNLCPECLHPGTLENYISGTSVERRAGIKPYEIPQESPIWEELAEWLAIGLNNTVLHWSPNIIILGGSMIVGEPHIPISAVISHLKKINTAFPEIPEIKKAKLGDFGGLHGALFLIKHLSDSQN